jgi:MoxR-like ATPase
MDLKCEICGEVVRDYVGDHVVEVHGVTLDQYRERFPTASVASPRLLQRLEANQASVKRALPVPPENLTINLLGVEFPVNTDVPESGCLPMPPEYRVPCKGDLGADVSNALISLFRKRSLFIWGLPGSGKDALFHAWSSLTRTPAIIRQVVPGTDIESWFFSRGFDQNGTTWEEGDVLRALRDGYITSTGRRVPYLFLISDFDRSDRSQAEHLRLVTDSIQGRVNGPQGKTYPVLPGTLIVATANTAGGGDHRGRMVSSNPLDASILDRFQRKFQFHWMDWEDEEIIVKAKFPFLLEKAPWVFPQMGNATKALRAAIEGEQLHAEFSHRGLCSILEHAEDMLVCNKGRPAPRNLIQRAARAWLDGLPDPDTRQEAVKLMDPHLKGGMINPDQTSGSKDPLVEGF